MALQLTGVAHVGVAAVMTHVDSAMVKAAGVTAANHGMYRAGQMAARGPSRWLLARSLPLCRVLYRQQPCLKFLMQSASFAFTT